MKLIKQFTFLITIALFSSCTQNNEEIVLELKYNIGDEQIIVSSTETSNNSSMSFKSGMEINFIVSDYTENEYTFTSDVLRVKSEIIMGDDIEKYDSDKDETQMTSDEKSMHLEFKDVLDSKFNISIDNLGNITKPFRYMDGEIVENTIIDMSNVQLIFPEYKVKVGTEWKGERINSLTGQNISSTYKIKSITAKEIEISVNSIVAEMSGVLSENRVSGTYVLDKTSCTLIKGTLEMNLQMGGSLTTTYYLK